MKIALDPGHGFWLGHPSGARGNGLIEDVVVLDTVNNNAEGMVDRIGHVLRGHGEKVIVTRGRNRLSPVSSIDIGRRCNIAIDYDADLMLSVHCNAAAARSARGFEIYVASGDLRSHILATKIYRDVVNACPELPGRGVRWDSQSQHPRLGILRGTYKHMPAMLIECAFLSNPSDAKLLASPQFRQRMASAIAHGIRTHLETG